MVPSLRNAFPFHVRTLLDLQNSGHMSAGGFLCEPQLRLYNLPPGAPRAPLPSLFLVRSPLASREITRAPRPQPQTCIFCTHPGACFAGPCPHSRACGWWVVPLNPRSHTSTLPSASSLGTIIVSETLLSPQTGWPHV